MLIQLYETLKAYSFYLSHFNVLPEGQSIHTQIFIDDCTAPIVHRYSQAVTPVLYPCHILSDCLSFQQQIHVSCASWDSVCIKGSSLQICNIFFNFTLELSPCPFGAWPATTYTASIGIALLQSLPLFFTGYSPCGSVSKFSSFYKDISHTGLVCILPTSSKLAYTSKASTSKWDPIHT